VLRRCCSFALAMAGLLEPIQILTNRRGPEGFNLATIDKKRELGRIRRRHGH